MLQHLFCLVFLLLFDCSSKRNGNGVFFLIRNRVSYQITRTAHLAEYHQIGLDILCTCIFYCYTNGTVKPIHWNERETTTTTTTRTTSIVVILKTGTVYTMSTVFVYNSKMNKNQPFAMSIETHVSLTDFVWNASKNSPLWIMLILLVLLPLLVVGCDCHSIYQRMNLPGVYAEMNQKCISVHLCHRSLIESIRMLAITYHRPIQ